MRAGLPVLPRVFAGNIRFEIMGVMLQGADSISFGGEHSDKLAA
jgi:hypothetical protein